MCRAPAVVTQAYSGQSLCARHLDRSVRKKVGRELRKQLSIDEPTTVLVAISGGKDSASMQSAGAGFRCIFKPSLELDFHLGVPFKESVDTKKSDAHLHFNLDFRF